jgi:hypothetical protein
MRPANSASSAGTLSVMELDCANSCQTMIPWASQAS